MSFIPSFVNQKPLLAFPVQYKLITPVHSTQQEFTQLICVPSWAIIFLTFVACVIGQSLHQKAIYLLVSSKNFIPSTFRSFRKSFLTCQMRFLVWFLSLLLPLQVMVMGLWLTCTQTSQNQSWHFHLPRAETSCGWWCLSRQKKNIPGSLCPHIDEFDIQYCQPWVDVITTHDDVSITRLTFSSRWQRKKPSVTVDSSDPNLQVYQASHMKACNVGNNLRTLPYSVFHYHALAPDWAILAPNHSLAVYCGRWLLNALCVSGSFFILTVFPLLLWPTTPQSKHLPWNVVVACRWHLQPASKESNCFFSRCITSFTDTSIFLSAVIPQGEWYPG